MKSGDSKSYRSAGQNGLTFILIFEVLPVVWTEKGLV